MRKLYCILLLLFIPGINKAGTMDSLKFKVDTTLVIKARTLERNSNKDKWYAVYGDFIEVKVEGMRYLIDNVAKGKKDSIILYINNIPMWDIHPHSISIDSKIDTGLIVFCLSRKSKALENLRPYYKTYIKPLYSVISVGVKENGPMETKAWFYLYYINIVFLSITFLLMVLIVFLILFLAKKYHFLQIEDKEKAPYSLAHIQLIFWTILISFSYVYLWIVNREMPDLPSSVLVLIGISIGTKGVAGYMDYTANIKNPARVPKKRMGFLHDILSDENGVINIQRGQMVIWTLVLGFIYIQTFINDLHICDFNSNILALMGISSGAYALLKPLEAGNIQQQESKAGAGNISGSTQTENENKNK